MTATLLHPSVRMVRAPNPGPYTLDGTNTYLVGDERPLVIDPGPADDVHLDELVRQAGEVSLIILTHTHPDHASGAQRFAEMTGAPVAAFAERACAGAPPIADGDVIEAPGALLRAVHTPGHASDHLTFWMGQAEILFSGDHVLGAGTTLVAYPDGNMSDYMASLRKARALGAGRILPGHGPVVEDPASVIDGYVTHRRMREEQILAALGEGAQTVEEIVSVVYAGVDASLHRAAGMNVRAHLDKLALEGTVIGEGETWTRS